MGRTEFCYNQKPKGHYPCVKKFLKKMSFRVYRHFLFCGGWEVHTFSCLGSNNLQPDSFTILGVYAESFRRSNWIRIDDDGKLELSTLDEDSRQSSTSSPLFSLSRDSMDYPDTPTYRQSTGEKLTKQLCVKFSAFKHACMTESFKDLCSLPHELHF